MNTNIVKDAFNYGNLHSSVVLVITAKQIFKVVDNRQYEQATGNTK